MAASASSYCAEQVRRFDHDRYLTCMFAPAARRGDLFALYAFNLEIAKTAEMVSEAALGELRLAWWREALEGIYAGRPPNHEVAMALAAAVRRCGLEREPFERLIEARALDLAGTAPATLAALEAYAEDTSAGLMHLALQVLDARGAEAAAAGRHVGIAWGLTGLLRAVPFHAAAKRLYLPRELTAAAGLEPGDLFELRSGPALCRVSEQMAGRAREHLAAARALKAQVPKRALPVLLLARLASQALASLEKAGYDPFDPSVQAPHPGRVWRLWWANLWRGY
jgi:phytoene synthase